ncbi:MAG TPA: DUF4266 domain-containing protein [Vicinamibacterales bacterium]|jgi:hypothetical protein
MIPSDALHQGRSNCVGRRRWIAALAIGLALFAGGCATVEPWQRARLADPCMTFDADSSQLAYMTHWQDAREGATGGYGVQSGGCGCK